MFCSDALDPSLVGAALLDRPALMDLRRVMICESTNGPLFWGHLRNQRQISRTGFGLHCPGGRRVFDDNLLVLPVTIMPRVREPAMQTAIMSGYELVHADTMPLLDMMRGRRL